MKITIFLILFLVPTAIVGQVASNTEPPHFLCDYIGWRNKDPDPDSDFEYMYQKRLSEAAGITKTDSEEVARRKMQLYWKKWYHEMTCDNNKFDTPKAGDAIKYAINQKFSTFFEDVVFNWKLDLNVVDPVDGRTILDYVEYQIEVNRGVPSNEKTLNTYREILLRKGAKRAKEIK